MKYTCYITVLKIYWLKVIVVRQGFVGKYTEEICLDIPLLTPLAHGDISKCIKRFLPFCGSAFREQDK